jgi:hypothetical protein
LAFESAVEQRSIFEHGAGDVEEAVTNCEESASMDAAAGSQGQDTWLNNAFAEQEQIQVQSLHPSIQRHERDDPRQPQDELR